MIFLLIFTLILIQPSLSIVPELSKDLKMVVVFGEIPGDIESSTAEKPWPDCITECLGIKDCVAARPLFGECSFYSIPDLKSITKLDEESKKKIAIKINLESCPPRSEAPPLLNGKCIITENYNTITGSMEYYKTEIIDSGDFWKFNYSIHKCVKDIPENYESLDLIDPKNYVYILNNKFLPGETFFLRGRTGPIDCSFSISFISDEPEPMSWPFYLKFINGRKAEYCQEIDMYHCIEVSTWNGRDYVNLVNVNAHENPYGKNEDFEIRISSTETQVSISMNGSIFYYDLVEEYPLPTTTRFVINENMMVDDMMTLYYIGWTGDCWYEPLE